MKGCFRRFKEAGSQLRSRDRRFQRRCRDKRLREEMQGCDVGCWRWCRDLRLRKEMQYMLEGGIVGVDKGWQVVGGYAGMKKIKMRLRDGRQVAAGDPGRCSL
jgi:hypothetical protein